MVVILHLVARLERLLVGRHAERVLVVSVNNRGATVSSVVGALAEQGIQLRSLEVEAGKGNNQARLRIQTEHESDCPMVERVLSGIGEVTGFSWES